MSAVIIIVSKMSVRSSCFCLWYDQSHRYCPCGVCLWYDQSHRYCPGSVCRWYDPSHRYCPCRAKLMKQMSPKACVLDPISTSLVFGCSDEIVPLLTAIVNQFLTTGLFPSRVKAAAVKPLWRKQLSFKATKTLVFSFILSLVTVMLSLALLEFSLIKFTVTAQRSTISTGCQ